MRLPLQASGLDAKNAAASATASATEKSPLISTVKGNGEALENTAAGTSVSPDASAEPKKTIMPVGDVLNRKDEKVNYASLMEAELNAPAAPMPTAPAPAHDVRARAGAVLPLRVPNHAAERCRADVPQATETKPSFM